MSDFMTDLSGVLKDKVIEATTAKHSTNTKAGGELDTVDFLQLMVAGFQNQSIDDVASTSEMMNQMMQMSVIQAVSSLSNLINQSTTLTYAASLVGKEVTIGQFNGSELEEIIGVVTGTGTVNGSQVVFVNGESYYLTDILAVGRLPGEEAVETAGADADAKAVGEQGVLPGSDEESDIVWGSDIIREMEAAEAAGASGASGASETAGANGAGAAADSQAAANGEAEAAQPSKVIGDGFYAVSSGGGQYIPTPEMTEVAAENLYETSL